MGKKKTASEKKKIDGKKQVLYISRSNPFSEIAWSESYTSLLLGIVVVMIVAVSGYTFLKGRHAHLLQATSSTATTSGADKLLFEKNLKISGKYTVAAGDDLTKISGKYYQTPDKWGDIAKANGITDPNYLPVGTTLVIPANNASDSAGQNASQNATGTIKGNSYIVQDGDYIWGIAERVYGDGNRAPDIIRVNNLPDSDHLVSGQVLKIPRP